ncbi:MAG: hypothetical protein IKE22_07275, partial [Atopobiaceae bacterium]|nr:hypothetical protein [Atopobiaceae bacterium]
IRDSSCCIVLNTSERAASRGTDIGYSFYEVYGVPFFEIVLDGEESLDEQVEDACAWLDGLQDDTLVLGFGGPRESEYPGVYDIAYHVMESILRGTVRGHKGVTPLCPCALL